MHHTFLIVDSIVAASLGIVGLVPYFRDIFRHKTKPERAMWWIYSVLFILLFAAQKKAGAHWLLVVSAGYILSAVLIAVLSLRYGYGTFHKRDVASLGIAALGLLLWLLTDQPLAAIVMVVIVDFAGFWLTLTKTWHAPHSETLISWQLSCAGAILSVFSADSWKPSIVIYPLYSVLGSGLLVWLIMYRRTKVKEDPIDF